MASAGNAGHVALLTPQGECTIWRDGNPETSSRLYCGSGPTALAISPDGKLLAAGSSLGSIRIWEVKSGKQLSSFTSEGTASPSAELCSTETATLQTLAFSPDNQRLATGTRSPDSSAASSSQAGLLAVWDWREVRVRWSNREHANHVHCVSFSPDGKLLATSGMAVKIWDAETGQPHQEFRDHSFHVPHVAFSPDGSMLASVGDRDKKAVLRNLATEETVLLRGHDEFLTGVAFSQDGKLIGTSSADGAVRLWNTDGTPVEVLYGADVWAKAVAFTPEGFLCASFRDGTVRLARPGLVDSRALFTCNSRQRLYDIAVSPDGETAMTISAAGELIEWPLSTRQVATEVHDFDSPARCMARSPDGKRVAAGLENGQVKLFDIESRRVTQTLNAGETTVMGVAFSPDGQWLASGAAKVKIWNMPAGELVRELDKHTNHVFCVAFSHNSKRLATGGADNKAFVWEVETWQATSAFEHGFWVGDAQISPDGKYLATATVNDNGEVLLWNLHTEALAARGVHHGAHCVAFSEDGQRLVSGGDQVPLAEIKVWSAPDLFELASQRGHTTRVTAVDILPAGGGIVSCSADGSVRLWGSPTHAAATGENSAD